MQFLPDLEFPLTLPGLTSCLGLVLGACVVTFVVYGFNIPTRWKLRAIPGPTPSWLLGSFPQFMKIGFHETHFQTSRKYGPVSKLFFGRNPVIIVGDPEFARKILLKNADRKNPFSGAAFARTPEQVEFDEASLLNSGATKARGLRGAWQPTFNPSNLAQYSESMNASATKLMDRLAKAQEDGSEVNIWRLFGDMTFDVVGSTAFGVDFNTQDIAAKKEDTNDISKSLVAASATIFARGGIGQGGILQAMALLMPFLTPVLRPLIGAMEDHGFMPQATKELLQSIRVIRTEAMKLAKTAREGSGRCPFAPGEERAVAPATGSFLQQIVGHKDTETKKPLSDPAVASQAMLFMLAGYETTANTLAFTLYQLARHPEFEQRAREEVDAFGREADPTHKDLQEGRFPYLHAVLMETLRTHPPGTATAIRTLGEDTQLGDHLLKAGSNVMVSILSLHYDEKLWPEPQAFRPERFLKDSPRYVPHHPYAHLPFGAGARQCIGMKFALQEATITLVRFLQRFRFELSPGQVPLQLGQGSTQGPKEGVFGTIHLRSEE